MALREITGPDGTKWQVYAVEPHAPSRFVPDDMGDGWLVFESGTHKCRIVPPPPDWETCPGERLLELMQCTSPVPKRKAPGEP